MYRLLIVATLLTSFYSARANPGATVPYTTYEAEAMTTSGYILGPDYTHNTVASEASGRQCVNLISGEYVQFTATNAANSLVVRYSVPDTTSGGGTNYTISLYTNGVFAEKLLMTSQYSWLYGADPFTNSPSAGTPRNAFDEVRTNNLVINVGDTVRLEVDSGDAAPYYDIDLVDLENATQVSQPGNSVSITASPYNADPTGVGNSTTALENCITYANAHGMTVWMPTGTYQITSTIYLPTGTSIQGAGMWYTTLVGNVADYANSSERITMYGGPGSTPANNVHLADFAIVGRLTYRNNNEPNDGLSGAFGTGSTISRIWVEHTKTGAWIWNSSGLVIDGCRFRDTIADGCNLNLGMQNTVVTNCTARGTGDDCFAMWPSTCCYSPVYTPGGNVFTQCTGQNNFLANGGAIYGGANNTIENCLFQDNTYGCGILFSTTFEVADTFSGTTTAQNCLVNRCGGYDPGYLWRGAVQICMDEYNGISGINMNNLEITNSASSGFNIIGKAGSLSSSTIAGFSIPNYGLGTSGQNGIWAESGTLGSLAVSNCTVQNVLATSTSVPGVVNSSTGFIFNFQTSSISVTFNTSPSGLGYTVDGTSYTSQQTFSWTPGSNHTISTTATQSGTTGTQYTWSSWSDSGAISHTVSPVSGTTYTANFNTQYYLTMNAGTGGGVSPASLWTNSGSVVSISATPSSGYTFGSWTGSGSGSYSGGNNSASVTMNAPITETASFNSTTTKIISLGGNLAFGNVTINTSSNLTLTIGNSGNATLTVSSISYPTGFSGAFVGAIPAGGSTNVTVTFSPTQVTGYGGNLTVNSDATSGTDTFAVSGAGVQVNPPSVLAMSYAQQPGNVAQGAVITPEVQVKAYTTNNAAVTNTAITITLGSGTGTLTGTLTRNTDSGGIAHFNDLSVNQAGPKTLTATVAVGSAPATNSASFMVIGSVAALEFTTQPGNAVAGVPFGQQPVIETVDTFGNPTTTGLPATLMVTVALTNGTGTLSGTTSYNIGTSGSDGTIQFTNLEISTAGNGNQLIASAAGVPSNSVPGAVIWLDANNQSSLTQDVNGGISGWNNLGTRGGTLGIATDDGTWTGPTNMLNSMNGQPVARFTSTSANQNSPGNVLTNSWAALDNGTDIYFFMAMRQPANPINNWGGFIGFGNSGAAAGKNNSSLGEDTGDSSNGFRIFRNDANTSPAYSASGQFSTNNYADGIGFNVSESSLGAWYNERPANGAAFVNAFYFSGSANGGADYWVDQNGNTWTNFQTSTVSYGNFNVTDFGLGAQLGINGGSPLDGPDWPMSVDIAEVLVYTNTMSVSDRATVFSYLQSKWLTGGGSSSISNALSAPFSVQSGTVPRQNITAITVSASGRVTLTYATTPSATYHLQSTPSLLPAAWTTVTGSTTNNVPGSSVTFMDPNPLGVGQRYYRTVSP